MLETKRVFYTCRICKTEHFIDFPKNIVKNSKNFPVTYFALHKFNGDTQANPNLVDADVLTSYFIDQKFRIRGSEAFVLDSNGNIMAQEDAEELIQFLTNHIMELQAANEELSEELQKYRKE